MHCLIALPKKIVKEVQPNLKVSQDWQKRYTDLKQTPREFNIGDHVYLKVKSKKSSLSLGRCSKLAPKYCGPFEVLSKIGLVAYQLALPPNIKVHDVFHVSLLKKYIHDATHIIDWDVIQVEPEGEFQTEPFRILDRKERMLRNRAIVSNKSAMEALQP